MNNLECDVALFIMLSCCVYFVYSCTFNFLYNNYCCYFSTGIINLFFSCDHILLCFIYDFFLFCGIRQIPYLAALFLVLHCCNMYTILKTLRRKTKGGLKLSYKLRAIAYRLSNEFAILVRGSHHNVSPEFQGTLPFIIKFRVSGVEKSKYLNTLYSSFLFRFGR